MAKTCLQVARVDLLGRERLSLLCGRWQNSHAWPFVHQQFYNVKARLYVTIRSRDTILIEDFVSKKETGSFFLAIVARVNWIRQAYLLCHT